MARKEQDLNKAYEAILKKREQNVALSPSRGDLEKIKKTRLEGITSTPAETLSDVIGDIKERRGVVENVSDVVKTTPTDTIGISPEIKYKSRFPSTNKALKIAEDIAEEVPTEDIGLAGILKNKKGFSKILPMLGMGAAGLAGLSIAGKVQAGELGEAGLETADLASDYIPGVGQVKMALRPTELGTAELPPEMMTERELYNAARRAKIGETQVSPSSEQPLLAPEDRVKYEDMKKKINFNVLNRLK